MILTWFESNYNYILISILSSFLFLILVFWVMRPWFYISKKISFKDETYRFKIINLSFIKVTDLSIHLRQITMLDAYPSGQDAEYRSLRVETDSFIYISGSISGLFNSHRPNCIQIKASPGQDLKSIIKNNGTHLELIINGRHGISNLQATKKRVFRHVSYVRDGSFQSGFTNKIV